MSGQDEVHKWLKSHYNPTTDDPVAKRVRFSDIREELESNFPREIFSDRSVSDAIKAVFPDTQSRPVGKSRQKHIFGLEKATNTAGAADDKLMLLRRIHDLEERVRQLENEKEKVCVLESRVKVLEAERSSFSFSSEFLSLLQPQNAIYHGPDTIFHFQSFSMDAIVAEIQQSAPHLFGLLKSMAAAGDGQRLEEVRVATSLSILLKSQSIKVLGVQLLITLMLLARSTNRQVCIIIARYDLSRWWLNGGESTWRLNGGGVMW